FYGSDTGNTEVAADAIFRQLEDLDVAEPQDIADCEAADLKGFDLLILGVSTWDIGMIQGAWDEKLGALSDLDLCGVRVALFGLGDAFGYPHTFVDGIAILWEALEPSGCQRIGNWLREDYDFDESRAVFDDDKLMGLALDEDNEPEKSEERIQNWLRQLRGEITDHLISDAA
ncbi:MAG: flavodoxin, partial [Planctomycetota bacterium]